MKNAHKGRIGILGGTFNPVHIGHLILAQCALEQVDLSKVLFVPCARPPHKSAAPLADAAHRTAMLEAALEGDPRFELCDIEIQRGGVSYSVDTLKALHEAQPSSEFWFIVGADTLSELHLWKDVYRLLELCRFAVACRPGTDLRGVLAGNLHLDPPWPERLGRNIVRGCLVDVSSTDIRHRVAEGMSIRYLVPAAVQMYIAEHGLYRM